MTYAIAETQGSFDYAKWEDISAETLSAAKRAASRAQGFQGSAVAVAIKHADGSYIPVAVKRDDPINMSAKGSWEEV